MVNPVVVALDGVITRLANLADNPAINYQQMVIVSTWLQTAFEVWLQYVLHAFNPSTADPTSQRQMGCYDRPRPPSELATHLPQDTFDKAQRYGRDKTRYSLVKPVFDQVLAWGIIRSGLYARAWEWTGSWMGTLGLSQDRMVRPLLRDTRAFSMVADRSLVIVDHHPHHHLRHPFPPVELLPHLRPRGETRLQQVDGEALGRRSGQDVGAVGCHRATCARGLPPDHRVGGEVFRPVAHAVYVGEVL